MQAIREIDALANYPSIDTELLRTFVAIADHGGFTKAGDAVNRTQSAVSMQMKRLEEDIVQRSLFRKDGRTLSLTAEGQVLLGYARRILKLHSEVFNTLREPHMVGVVKIGSPDDYVMRFLPGILSQFAQAYPLVQVEVHCEPSDMLLQRHDLDLTIVTRQPGNEIGQLLRREHLVWVEADGQRLTTRRPCRWRCSTRIAFAGNGPAMHWTPSSVNTGSPTAAPACRRSWQWSVPAWPSRHSCRA